MALKEILQDAFRRACFNIDSRPTFFPGVQVWNVLEAQGWRRDVCRPDPICRSPIAITKIFAPDGRQARPAEDKDAHLLYKQERRKVAETVYGMR